MREATPNEVKVAVTGSGRADKEQVGRMVAVCLGLPEVPKQDDTSDALAIAIWAANAERAGRRSAVVGAGSRVGEPDDARTPAAATGTSEPCARRCERAEKATARDESRDRLARRHRRGDRVRLADRRGRRGRVSGLRVAVRARRRAAGQPAEAVHPSRRPRGPPGAVRLPHRGGARVLRAAADGDRRRAEGRDGHRRLAPDRGAPARDHAAGPGGARVDPGHRQASSPSG